MSGGIGARGSREAGLRQAGPRDAGSQALVVDYAGRGAVLWRAGRLRFAGPRCQNRIDLERAVAALLEMEQVDLSSADQVRGALLSIAGAHIRRDVGR